MASISFKQKGKSTTIYYRVRGGRSLDVTKSLPFSVLPEFWSSKKQQVKPTHVECNALNNELGEFKTYMLGKLGSVKVRLEKINLEKINIFHNEYFNPQKSHKEYKFLGEYIEHFITVTEAKNFNPLKTWVGKFSKVELYEIDEEWLNRFVSKNEKRGYAKGTIGKRIKQLKQVLRHALKNNITVKSSVLDYKIPKSATYSTYLSDSELNLIFQFQFNNDRLNNAKMLFLIGCTTGLRVSDLMRLNYREIEGDYIETITKKTKQPLIIPIDPRVKEFLKVVRPISDQKFNNYIKEICKIVGIDVSTIGYAKNKENRRELKELPKYKLITSHTMRRSFASNLYGKVPTVVIMAITGHTTEKSFLTYIKKPQRDFAEQLNDYYRCNSLN